MNQSKKCIEANNCKTNQLKQKRSVYNNENLYTNEIKSVDSLSNCKNSQKKEREKKKKRERQKKIKIIWKHKLVFAFIRFAIAKLETQN